MSYIARNTLIREFENHTRKTHNFRFDSIDIDSWKHFPLLSIFSELVPANSLRPHLNFALDSLDKSLIQRTYNDIPHGDDVVGIRRLYCGGVIQRI